MTRVSDVVSRLLAKLDEVEEFARDAMQRRWLTQDNYIEDENGGEVARFNLKRDAQHAGLNEPQAVLRLCQAHREIIDMFPVSAPHLDTEGSFYGFQSRDCGEHRTVGAHRAWCFDCSEWCLPDQPCRRCHGVSEALRIIAAGYGIQEKD